MQGVGKPFLFPLPWRERVRVRGRIFITPHSPCTPSFEGKVCRTTHFGIMRIGRTGYSIDDGEGCPAKNLPSPWPSPGGRGEEGCLSLDEIVAKRSRSYPFRHPREACPRHLLSGGGNSGDWGWHPPSVWPGRGAGSECRSCGLFCDVVVPSHSFSHGVCVPKGWTALRSGQRSFKDASVKASGGD